MDISSGKMKSWRNELFKSKMKSKGTIRQDDILSLSASPGPLTDEEVLYITKLDLVTLQTIRHMFSYLYSMTNCPSSLLTGRDVKHVSKQGSYMKPCVIWTTS